MMRNDRNMLLGIGARVLGGVVALVVAIRIVSGAMITVQADEIVVKQDLIGGDLHVWSTPGPRAVLWGAVTRYKRSAQLWFSARTDEGHTVDESIKVRFNDGGHGNISGSLRYTLPTDSSKMIALHQTYHSMEAIDHELV
ncbi:MAG: hypothetical protein FWD17_20015, partial [Polyangiaceae bacterium]|nr:hypothetical protein [Polyangiaceae bacterium]